MKITWFDTFSQILYLCGSLFLTTSAFANPLLGNIAAGNVSIQQSGNTMNINQSSSQAILNWQTFNIGQQEATHFIQPAGGIALNRISPTAGASQIYGELTATGQIILINPAGIYFGPSSVVNVGGLIATTANITDANFLNGNYQFSNVGPGSIINAGELIAADHGLIALVGSNVQNNGLIKANLGQVVLASGNAFTVNFGDDLVNFAFSGNSDKSGSVSNTGTLIANGGQILVTAQAAQGVLDNIINMQGVAEAKSVYQQNGDIVISGDPNGGTVNVSGKLIASGKHKGQTGGTVEITGYDVALNSPTLIDVSGNVGGGHIQIGRDDSGHYSQTTTLGDGVSLLANTASGNGGLIETSGKLLNLGNVFIDTLSANGSTGTWLLDPVNAYLADVVGDATGILPGDTFMSTSTLVSQLNSSNITVASLNDLFVDTPINWTSTHSLTLTAAHDLNINAAITDFQGSPDTDTVTSGNLTLNAGHYINANLNSSLCNSLSTCDAAGYTNTITLNGGNVTFNGFLNLMSNLDVYTVYALFYSNNGNVGNNGLGLENGNTSLPNGGNGNGHTFLVNPGINGPGIVNGTVTLGNSSTTTSFTNFANIGINSSIANGSGFTQSESQIINVLNTTLSTVPSSGGNGGAIILDADQVNLTNSIVNSSGGTSNLLPSEPGGAAGIITIQSLTGGPYPANSVSPGLNFTNSMIEAIGGAGTTYVGSPGGNGGAGGNILFEIQTNTGLLTTSNTTVNSSGGSGGNGGLAAGGNGGNAGTITVTSHNNILNGLTGITFLQNGGSGGTGSPKGSAGTSSALSTTSTGGTFTLNSPLTIDVPLDVTAAGGIDISSSITSTNTITFNNPVTLGTSASISGTTIDFANNVTGAGDALTVKGSGAVTFGGAVAVGSLNVTGSSIKLDGNVTTTGSQVYNSPVVLGGNTVLSSSGAVDFNSGITGGGFNLTLNGIGSSQFAFNGPFTGVNNFSVTGAGASMNSLSLTNGNAQTWNITGANAGDVTGVPGVAGAFNFANIESIIGGSGNNTFNFGGFASSVKVQLNSDLFSATVIGAGSLTYKNIEHLIGNGAFNNPLLLPINIPFSLVTMTGNLQGYISDPLVFANFNVGGGTNNPSPIIQQGQVPQVQIVPPEALLPTPSIVYNDDYPSYIESITISLGCAVR